MTIARLLFVICVDIIDVTLDRIAEYIEQRDGPRAAPARPENKTLYVVATDNKWDNITYN